MSLLFVAAAVVLASTLLVGFYLDFRRHNLVRLGLLPKETPEIFYLALSTDLARHAEFLAWVFSPRFVQSPDRPSRLWSHLFRWGLCGSVLLVVAGLLAALL